ncbi:hypothetical protein PTSG_06540 [Salpingoeca rosetta]|uniref:Aspartyl/asparaginy/proline hydroxylase domain-containing protein n=1 Tax=Salpingoeca rosetta (strain ATCC 50818 / BSB-021) TaxID=946362 RepID=F2UG38_SALR5|nr:uncharacterized protein PTSG_06540 [Salpingoeca rosetta]EGD75466.1 hypothetical protein PTSG_06540 [Salpingoeca rosetta]|eukprot:XP_004991923.1 hypothetical protein PTSG_06540 [Salpingoeca rosetta]
MHGSLVREFDGLESSGRLVEENSCIRRPPGEWHTFEAVGPWVDMTFEGCDEDAPVACRLLTELKTKANVTVLRMGYSKLTRETWLRPRFGASNRRLVLRIGLTVPRHPIETILGPAVPPDMLAGNTTAHTRAQAHNNNSSSSSSNDGRNHDAAAGAGGDDSLCASDQCALVSAGDETRCLLAGKVLIMDDSYVHQEVNACDSKLSVFDVVILHPDVPAAEQLRTKHLAAIEAM